MCPTASSRRLLSRRMGDVLDFAFGQRCLQESLECARRVLDEGQGLQEGRPQPDELSSLKVQTLGFVSCALHYAEAVALLARAGFAGPATALTRTLVELDIDLAFILRSPQVLERMLMDMGRFWDLAVFVAAGQAQRTADRTRHFPRHVDMRKASKRRKAMAKDFPAITEKKWCTDNISERAKITGRERVYEWAYEHTSGAVHSGGQALRYALEVRPAVDGNIVVVRPGAAPLEDGNPALFWSAMSVVGVARTAGSMVNVDVRAACDAVIGRINAARPREPVLG